MVLFRFMHFCVKRTNGRLSSRCRTKIAISFSQFLSSMLKQLLRNEKSNLFHWERVEKFLTIKLLVLITEKNASIPFFGPKLYHYLQFWSRERYSFILCRNFFPCSVRGFEFAKNNLTIRKIMMNGEIISSSIRSLGMKLITHLLLGLHLYTLENCH